MRFQQKNPVVWFVHLAAGFFRAKRHTFGVPDLKRDIWGAESSGIS